MLPVILPAKLGLCGNSREFRLRKSKLWQNPRKIQRTKERNIYFMGKEDFGRCSFEQVRWRKERVQCDDHFSLAELQWQWISCRRCSVHISLLRQTCNDHFLSRVFSQGCVIDNSPCNFPTCPPCPFHIPNPLQLRFSFMYCHSLYSQDMSAEILRD